MTPSFHLAWAASRRQVRCAPGKPRRIAGGARVVSDDGRYGGHVIAADGIGPGLGP
jgi:hypothetical protein